MRVTRAQADASRERILDEASRLLRERGLEGVGVAQIMKEAGLTHGGFYSHFESKEDLAAQACRRAQDAAVEGWKRIVGSKGRKALGAIVRAYLTPRHRDNPGAGCPVAALGAEAGRGDAKARHELAAGIEEAVTVLEGAMRGEDVAKRRKALAAYAAMVGAMVVSRATRGSPISKEVLDATGSLLLEPPRMVD